MAGLRRSGAFPPASLPDLSGGERSIAEAWKDGSALVFVGHKTCKTSRQTLPYVNRIHQRSAPGHATFAVLQDTPEDAAELKRSLQLELPILLDRDPYPFAEALGLEAVPTLFLVSREGQIARATEAFSRVDLMAFAEALGVVGSLFDADDPMPAMKPG